MEVRDLICLDGLFDLSPCDECLAAGQNVFLGPRAHLARPEGFLKSQQFCLMTLVHCYFQMPFEKRH